MIKVKLTLCDNSKLSAESFLKQTPGLSGRWGDVQFYVNKEINEYDYWVVYENLPLQDSAICPKENIIFVAAEPTEVKRYDEKFLNQFSKIITCQKRIQGPSVYYMAPGHTWFPKINYDELSNRDKVDKSKLISLIVSNKAGTPGHKKRLDFCLKLKEHFGDKMDIFGRGINDFEDKWDVLAPYKYSIAMENSAEEDNLTEKIGDCYTALTFPFYHGCPNIDKYYSKDSYELIDIDDFEGTCGTIEKIINDEHHYAQHLKSLTESKHKYINQFVLLPLIANLIKKEYMRSRRSPSTKITLNQSAKFQKKTFKLMMHNIINTLKSITIS